MGRRVRAREFGIEFRSMEPEQLNTITDVKTGVTDPVTHLKTKIMVGTNGNTQHTSTLNQVEDILNRCNRL